MLEVLLYILRLLFAIGVVYAGAHLWRNPSDRKSAVVWLVLFACLTGLASVILYIVSGFWSWGLLAGTMIGVLLGMIARDYRKSHLGSWRWR